jgi:hypothetical protein
MVRRFLCAAVFALVVPALSHASPLTAFGTATVDGLLLEWAGAASVDLTVNIPGGGTTPATLFVMNDDVNLYLALRFARAGVDAANTFGVEIDANRSGALDDGDDAFLLNVDTGFFDDFRTSAPPCPPGVLCGLGDTDLGGTNDGAGAFLHQGGFSVYELAHPLHSGDAGHDMALSAGDPVGFYFFLRMIAQDVTGPDAFGDTMYPTFGFGQIRIAKDVPEPAGLTTFGIATALMAWRRRVSSRRGAVQLEAQAGRRTQQVAGT